MKQKWKPVDELALTLAIYKRVLALQKVPLVEELHDLQYNLCEVQKFLSKPN